MCANLQLFSTRICNKRSVLKFYELMVYCLRLCNSKCVIHVVGQLMNTEQTTNSEANITGLGGGLAGYICLSHL